MCPNTRVCFMQVHVKVARSSAVSRCLWLYRHVGRQLLVPTVTCFCSDRAPPLFPSQPFPRLGVATESPLPSMNGIINLFRVRIPAIHVLYSSSNDLHIHCTCIIFKPPWVDTWYLRPETTRSFLQPHKINESEVCNFVFFKCKQRLGDGRCKSLVATWPVEILKYGNPRKSLECSN